MNTNEPPPFAPDDYLRENDGAGLRFLGHVAGPMDEHEGYADEARSLAMLRALYYIQNKAEQMTCEYVDHARENGASWSQVGGALGVSKQAAQQRYGGR